ncbi:ferredoxin [Streptomyces millisiae]|uniref:Ferredoxin n=1 Tax=Streptomyces millisiae TaxID=3075542 RepID=A0ABU2LI68_9ACTN|nr:ferredoxin [Streptomyces sp. DSM 44918]MDT0317180.1 ferredoxin [Streptomyces sp. DSM 44918]
MRVSVDQDRCVGAGQCAQTSEEVFDQSEEDGLVVLLAENPPAAAREAVRRAAAGCPGGAISIAE